ncbi:hypothetical protein P692DRAFT_20175806 [Suillus brevipes Sb2]|nr:hypothetical protein P692DRAFT_20175806 [Suillus brevipes Sb2]
MPALASFLSLGRCYDSDLSLHIFQLPCSNLLNVNPRKQRMEHDLMHSPERQRIEQAAKFEGITFEEAIKRRKGFRYLC